MKINLIGKSFNTNEGQGIYRYSGELFECLKEKKIEVSKNDSGEVNHVQQPELIWQALFKKNVITTVHDVMPIFNNERKFLFRLFFYVSMLTTIFKSKIILASSESTKKDIEKYFPFAKNKIKKIYLWIDKNRFYSFQREIKEKGFTTGYIGGLGKRKNIEYILSLAKKIPNAKFIIAGKGKEKERLEKIKEQNNLKNVNFIGFVSEDKMNEFYNSLDLFVFPSLYEGFGLPVLEAMSCGVPCLVANKGSLSELVPDKSFFLDLDNVTATSKIITNLIRNKSKLKNRRIKVLTRAKQFDKDRAIGQIIREYIKVLNS